MANDPSDRLDGLVQFIKSRNPGPLHEVAAVHEEAIRLAIYSGRSQLAGELIESYRNLIEEPVPYEIGVYCDFSTGIMLWRSGKFEEALHYYSAAGEAAEKNNDIHTAARCLMAHGVIMWSRGDFPESLELLNRAVKGLRSRTDASLVSCLNWLGVVNARLRNFSTAWSCYTEALGLLDEEDSRSNRGYLLCNMGLLCQQMGLIDQAEKSFRESMEIQQRIGNAYGYADSLANLGMLLLKYCNKPGGALLILQEAAGLQLENGERGKAGLVLTNAAVAKHRSGDTPGAMELFDRAEELIIASNDLDFHVEFCGMKAETYMAIGDYQKAEELFDRGSEIQEENLPGGDDKSLLRVHSELYAKKGDHRKAYDLMLRSLAALEEMDSVKSGALQKVIQMISDSASRDRELREAKYQAEILEERNRALAASEERFRSLVHSMAGIGVMAVDSGERITFWNRTCEGVFGYSSGEVQGRNAVDALVPGHLRNWFRSLLSGEVSGSSSEVSLPASDGSLREVRLSPVRLSRDETFLILVDLTDQRRAESKKSLIEEQMRRAHKLEALGTLAGGIAHDFNNLLQGILGNASVLCESLEQGTGDFQSAELIRNAAERSRKLCLQMLDYAGVKPLGYELIHMNELIWDASLLLETAFPGNAELVLRLSPEEHDVMGDAVQLRQVVMNLATNGAEAITDQGRVFVETGTRHMERTDFADNLLENTPPGGDYFCLTVRDEGSGMEPGVLSRIFDPFFSTRQTGRGLGLSAVIGIIRSHGGAITLRTAPGEGSEFSVFLALAPGRSPCATEQPASPEESSLQGRTVLVVDDEEIVRETISAILRSSGCVPVVFSGGAEVLESLQGGETPGDLIILDLTMPGMSGVDVFNGLVERGISIPVLIVSGYSGEKLETVFPGTKPGGFLRKPFTPEELRQKMDSILSSP